MKADIRGSLEREIARAKVNLFLHVLGQRPEGYHTLESMVVFPAIGDLIEVRDAAEEIDVTTRGPFCTGLERPRSNLVYHAAKALADRIASRPGAHVTVTKSLPVAAGLGGGSADAAATLRLLSRLWPDAPTGDALRDIAFSLGADTPVCLLSRPSMVSGVGESLAPAPSFPGFWVVLANPKQHLPTSEVFNSLEKRDNLPGPQPPGDFASFDALTRWLMLQRNDLEMAARRIRPIIGQVLSALNWDPRCRLARMSGSGATCFGLFETDSHALAAAERIRRTEPGWWVAAAPVARWEGAP